MSCLYIKPTYTLYEIVKKINDGSIIPIGETNHDNKAFKRMEEIKSLVDLLMEDFYEIYYQNGKEASVVKAKEDVKAFLEDLDITINEVLENKY